MKNAKSPEQVRIRHHARYLEAGVIYHVSTNTLNDEFFLHPTKATNKIILGVLGLAQKNFPQVKLFAYAFMSNHMHLMVSGTPHHLPRFVGFLKGEISRRLGIEFGEAGPKWKRMYSALALLTNDSVLKSFKYILGHGAKEDLVESPLDWPGIHCAHQLISGGPRKGRWFNGTKWGKAFHRAKARGKKVPGKAAFWEEVEVVLTPLPQWAQRRARTIVTMAKRLIEEIADAEKSRRKLAGIRVYGKRALSRQSRKTKKASVRPPWFKKRRRCVVAWISPEHPEAKAYLERHRLFQEAYQRAAHALKCGAQAVRFPQGAWLPSTPPLPVPMPV